jgi:MoaA/NifB/PqqE/SkfB family radical SAM enzyme
MSEDGNYIHLIDESIRNIFKSASAIVLKDPSQAYFLLKTVRWQKRAAEIRQKWREDGIHVPPFMFVSITNRCNLKCMGCFPRAKHRLRMPEMSESKLRGIIEEARELGISFILLAGGEPLVRPEILDITKDFPEIIFPLITNGLLIDEELLQRVSGQKNVVPLISLEGYRKETDNRRGKGVYDHLQGVIRQMRDDNIFFGLSFTITKLNFDTVTNEDFIKYFLDLACKLFFFVEYVPIEQGPENWILTEKQRDNLIKRTYDFGAHLPGLFFAFPGNEEKFGGCLSAGRGFVHVNPEGNLEPCPFVPYSDTNLRDSSLKEALRSQFLREIRQNHERLEKRQGSCTLWEKREWVRSLFH